MKKQFIGLRQALFFCIRLNPYKIIIVACRIYYIVRHGQRQRYKMNCGYRFQNENSERQASQLVKSYRTISTCVSSYVFSPGRAVVNGIVMNRSGRLNTYAYRSSTLRLRPEGQAGPVYHRKMLFEPLQTAELLPIFDILLSVLFFCAGPGGGGDPHRFFDAHIYRLDRFGIDINSRAADHVTHRQIDSHFPLTPCGAG